MSIGMRREWYEIDFSHGTLRELFRYRNTGPIQRDPTGGGTGHVSRISIE